MITLCMGCLRLAERCRCERTPPLKLGVAMIRVGAAALLALARAIEWRGTCDQRELVALINQVHDEIDRVHRGIKVIAETLSDS